MPRIALGSAQDKWIRYSYDPEAAGQTAQPTNEVQSLTVDATGGTYTITCLGQTTAGIAPNATAAAVKAALVAAGVPTGDVQVTGGVGAAGGGTPYVFTYTGAQAGRNVAQITTNAGSLTGGAGTATPSTTTAGGTAVTIDLLDEKGRATKIPDNAVIIGWYIDPEADFVTPGGTPTIKLGVDDAGLGSDLFNPATNYNDADYLVATQSLQAAHGQGKKVSKSGGTKVQAVVAAAALSSGKLNLHVCVRAGAA